MSNTDDDISNLLNELSTFAPSSPNVQKAVVDNTPLAEEDLQQYVLNKTKALIEAGLGAVQDLTPNVVASSDSREIDALSKLVASTAQALDALQKTALIKKKAEADEKIERIKQEGKKELALMQQSQNRITTNNNFLIASREDIMKKLFSEENTIENNKN